MPLDLLPTRPCEREHTAAHVRGVSAERIFELKQWIKECLEEVRKARETLSNVTVGDNVVLKTGKLFPGRRRSALVELR